jgi:predicted dehydrogenase
VSVVATRPRLGFLGVGWIGRKRLEALAESGVAHVAAIADPAVDGALASLDELLAEPLDGVVIATPTALHAEQARTALEHGLAVFCQKPLALDADGARAVVESAREADRLLAVDFCYRCTGAARAVKREVESGRLGEIFAADLVFHNAYGPDKPWSTDPRLAGGGCLLDLGIHLVDLALWTLGFPEVVSVAARLRGRPLEHYADAQLELASGTIVHIACSWHLHAGRDCVLGASFHGTDGGAALRNVDGSFYDFVAMRHTGARAETLQAPPDDWGGRAVTAWARRLAAGEHFDPAAAEYVRTHEVVERIYEAAP